MSGSGRGQPVSLGVGVASWCVWDGRGQPVGLGWAWPAGVSGVGVASPGMFARGLLRNLPRLSSPPRGTVGVCLLAVHMEQILPKDKAET